MAGTNNGLVKEKDQYQQMMAGELPKRLSPKQELLLRVFVAEGDIEKAAAKVGYSYGTARDIVMCPTGRNYLESIFGALDAEFKLQYKKVITCVGKGLDHSEPQIYLAAASLWLKTNKNKMTVELTAEDVVQKMMKGNGNGDGVE